MFIATMSTIAKLWKEPRCPSIDEQIKKMWYMCIHTHTDTHTHTHTNTHNIFFIHSSADGHLGSFHSLAIVDIAAINIWVHVPIQITTFVSLG